MDAESAATARIMYHLRGGGKWDLPATREAVRKITAAWPEARKAVDWYDRFRSRAAADAAARGVDVIVFGAPGFPSGPSPHAEAARASATARFWYVAPPLVAGQRRAALAGDERACAIDGSFRDARGLLAAIDAAGAPPGPRHVQWGLGACAIGEEECRALAASYGRLLPPGSEIVATVPDRAQGAEFARLAGLRPVAVGDLACWLNAAGGLVVVSVIDVRAYERETLAEELRGGGGRIMAVVARRP